MQNFVTIVFIFEAISNTSKSHDFWRCFVCNTTVPMSQSFVQHLRTSAHFTALCSSVRGQSKLALQVEKVYSHSLVNASDFVSTDLTKKAQNNGGVYI